MMSAFLKIYILFNLHYILIECLIPGTVDLSVRKLDKKLIERKRQDNVDMCRLFNAEANTQDIHTNKYDRKGKHDIRERKKLRRSKRDTVNASERDAGNMFVNPAMNIEDEQRVEKIVDRIYDDLLEKGQNIPYRRRELPKAAPTEGKNNELSSNLTESGRRFEFAPAKILPPTSPEPPIDHSADLSRKPPRFPHGIVPYFIDPKTYDSHLSDLIMKGFDYVERATCIRLQRLRESPKDLDSLQKVVWLYITNPSGVRQCVHSNERAEMKGVQMIVFGYDCMSLGDITHEVMHILGFSHEHIRPDRDQHITILWDNIKPGYRKYFELINKSIVESLPYDYASIMHYPPRAFSRNGQLTILTKPGVKIGQRESLSELDIEKVNMLYSTECVKRNREYLLKTCPSVVRADVSPKHITQEEIEDYFEDRLWPFGVVNYKFKDRVEFSTEETANINAVIRHLEKETCIEFRDLTTSAVHSRSTETDSDSDDERSEKYIQLGDNDTKATLPQLSSSSEETDQITLHNEIKDANENMGKDMKEKNPALRIKRAIPPTPQRRHANSILVLTRSPNPGCFCPHPGKPDGTYILKINTDCFNSVNDLLHLFVHVLGLDHQHNMYDRDSYLHISWDQLADDVKQEMKRKLPPAASVGFPYDYQSVMHYPWLQIKNGITNIMYPIWNDGWAMGHWQGLSSTDVQKINLLYFKQCVKRKQQAGTTTTAP